MGDFDFDIDSSSDDTYSSGYGRQGCGCGAFIVGALVVFIALVWMFHHKRHVELAVIIGCLVTVAYLVRGPVLAFSRRPARLDPKGLPTPLAKVQVGQSTHTAGLVGMIAAPIHAPLGAPPCVFFRIVIEPLDHPGAAIFEARSADEIVLEDGSGAKVVVRLDGAAWRVKRRHEIISSPSAPDEHVVTYLAERGIHGDRDGGLRPPSPQEASPRIAALRSAILDRDGGLRPPSPQEASPRIAALRSAILDRDGGLRPPSPQEASPRIAALRSAILDHPVRAYVEWIAPHELVFVRGFTRGADVQPSSDYRTSEAAPPIEIVASPGHPVIIALEPIAGR